MITARTLEVDLKLRIRHTSFMRLMRESYFIHVGRGIKGTIKTGKGLSILECQTLSLMEALSLMNSTQEKDETSLEKVLKDFPLNIKIVFDRELTVSVEPHLAQEENIFILKDERLSSLSWSNWQSYLVEKDATEQQVLSVINSLNALRDEYAFSTYFYSPEQGLYLP